MTTVALSTSVAVSSGFDHPCVFTLPDADELVHLRLGQAFTTTLVIAQLFQRKHGNVLRTIDSLIADGTIDRLNFEPISYADAQGRQQRMILLTETGALIALPFLGGKKGRAGQARIVHAFMKLRDEVRWEQSMDWHGRRRDAAASFRMMSDALQEVRAANGKVTHEYHYANEARLINNVLFGAYDKLDRDCLSQAKLALVEKIEIRNAILISQGKSYSERKTMLLGFASSLRESLEIHPALSGSHVAKSVNRLPHHSHEGRA